MSQTCNANTMPVCPRLHSQPWSPAEFMYGFCAVVLLLMEVYQLCFPVHLSAPNKDPTLGFPGNVGPLAALHTVSFLLMEVELLNSSPPGNAPVRWGTVRFLFPSHSVKKTLSVGILNKMCHAGKYRSRICRTWNSFQKECILFSPTLSPSLPICVCVCVCVSLSLYHTSA